METHKLFMVAGMVVMVIGMFLLLQNWIYPDDLVRTFVPIAMKFGVVGIGYLIYKHGENLRDAR